MPRDTSSTDEETMSGESEQNQDRSVLTRRRLVASGAATWATVSIAGCNYITDPGVDEPTVTTETTTTDDPSASTDTSEDTGGSTDAPDGTETPASPDTPTETTDEEEEETTTTTSSCASIGRFARGMEVGLHVGIYDPETGDPLGADAIESVTIEFPDADYGPVELNWEGPHEAYDRDTWGSKIETDGETEPGTYEYEVDVESDRDDVATTISDQFTVV
jgi:hypothetical protein